VEPPALKCLALSLYSRHATFFRVVDGLQYSNEGHKGVEEGTSAVSVTYRDSDVARKLRRKGEFSQAEGACKT
jgi:hypothetical protein